MYLIMNLILIDFRNEIRPRPKDKVSFIFTFNMKKNKLKHFSKTLEFFSIRFYITELSTHFLISFIFCIILYKIHFSQEKLFFLHFLDSIRRPQS